jgi:hypothetical protein
MVFVMVVTYYFWWHNNDEKGTPNGRGRYPIHRFRIYKDDPELNRISMNRYLAQSGVGCSKGCDRAMMGNLAEKIAAVKEAAGAKTRAHGGSKEGQGRGYSSSRKNDW